MSKKSKNFKVILHLELDDAVEHKDLSERVLACLDNPLLPRGQARVDVCESAPHKEPAPTVLN